MTSGKERAFGLWDTPPLLADLFHSLSERSRALLGLAPSQLPAQDLVALAELVLSRRGEVSGAIVAEAFLDAWEKSDTEMRGAFMNALLDRFGPDTDEVSKAIEAYRATPSPETLAHLHETAEPRRQELFRRINFARNGTSTLVRMREHLLGMLPSAPQLRTVDNDFRHLLSSWFNRGFLTLRSIGWNTPANILEALIRYEAVHEIDGWDDLRRRLEPEDRRCFGFFHPQLQDEPLIFVEVALTDHIPSAIGPMLASGREPMDAAKATTAVFYSISNCQQGLAGVSLGNFLIKQVVADLRRDLPRLENFVTLSPVPGFASWLEASSGGAQPDGLDDEKAHLRAMLVEGWNEREKEHIDAVRKAFLPLAATYLLHARRKDGRPIDPVARFHLGNGAQIEQLNFLGDLSPRGMGQSHGLMVNYLYRLDDIEKNHEAYAENGTIAASPALKKMARAMRPEVI